MSPPFLRWSEQEIVSVFCKNLRPALHIRGKQHFGIFNFLLVDESCIASDDPGSWKCNVCSIAPNFFDMLRGDFENLRPVDIIKPALKVLEIGSPK